MREGDRGIERQRKEGVGGSEQKRSLGKGRRRKEKRDKMEGIREQEERNEGKGSRNEGVKGRWKAGRTDSGLGWREEVKMKGLRERKEERE